MSKELNLLIKKCLRSDKKAQMQLYDMYCKAMFYVAYKYLNNEEEAKDVTQEGFLNAFFKLDSYKKDTNFGAWLKKIIINKCLDALKKRSLKTVFIDDQFLEIVDDSNWFFDVKIKKEEILQAVEKLSEKHRIVVTLYLLEGYDHVEISSIINIPVKTSRVRLRRARLQLQVLLKSRKNEARY